MSDDALPEGTPLSRGAVKRLLLLADLGPFYAGAERQRERELDKALGLGNTGPTVVRERLDEVAQGIAGVREGLVRIGDAAQQATRAMVVYTDRMIGAALPDDNKDPAFTGDMVAEAMRALRDAYVNQRIREQAEAAGRLTPAQVAEAFGFPPEFVTEPSVDLDANEELIRSTRAEFPDDPWDYGRLEPDDPMSWSPPPDGEETPPCPS